MLMLQDLPAPRDERALLYRVAGNELGLFMLVRQLVCVTKDSAV